MKEDPSPTLLRKYQEEDEEEAVKSLAIKDSEIFVFYLFFNYFTLSFFSILFLPPTPTTHTHDPRHLVPLSVLSSYVNNTKGVSQIICVKCQREVLKFSNWKNSGKKCNEALRNQLAEYHLTRQKCCAKDSPAESGLNDRLKKNPLCLSRFSLQKNAEVTFILLVCLLISSELEPH